ncbi:MAG: GGDEF domain-containing protein, partial [Nanobdellota archaeon]
SNSKLQEEKYVAEEKASLDSLTGLYNQNTFYPRLEEILSKAKRHECDVSLLAIDADYFKEINDNYGHHEGDRAIAYIGQIIQDVTRKEDIGVRYGGDEFAVILDGVSQQDAYNVAEKITKSIEENPFTLENGKRLDLMEGKLENISLSIGIASAFPSEDQSPEGLYKKADKALYKAKDSSENIAFYSLPDNVLQFPVNDYYSRNKRSVAF